MEVPLLDLKAQYQRIKAEVQKAVDEVLESQLFILGPAVQRFEKEAAAYLNSGAAIGVASGSDALLLSMMALGIGAGDAVLVPSFTFFSSVSSITRLGALPLLVDVEPDSYVIDLTKVEALVEERFDKNADGGLIDRRTKLQLKAIVPVHLFGQCCSPTPLLSFASKHRLRVVEDVAQAFGARAPISSSRSKAAGTLGDLGCFSFFPTKTLGGLGDGGLVATADKELAEKIRMLRVHGASAKYRHERIGLNSRLDSIQAATLSVKLRYIDQWCAERIERARQYQQLFSETGLLGEEILALPALGKERSHVFSYYVIRARRRDDLQRYLQERGIQTEVYYPIPLHLQPCFAYLGYRKGDLPNSELASAQVLALPMYPELTVAQQEKVVRAIEAFYRR